MDTSILNSKCNNWVRYSKYEKKFDENRIYRFYRAKDAKVTQYNPFEIANKLIVDFLNIGWEKVQSKGGFRELTEKFVNNYGMLTMPANDNADVYEDEEFIIEKAEKLYLHFYEFNRDMRYPETELPVPVWEFGVDGVPMTVKLIDNLPSLLWNTPDLLTAIELAYALLVTENVLRLKYCKHCHIAYFGANPKSEFCSSRCRNQWNVYRSREKNKEV